MVNREVAEGRAKPLQIYSTAGTTSNRALPDAMAARTDVSLDRPATGNHFRNGPVKPGCIVWPAERGLKRKSRNLSMNDELYPVLPLRDIVVFRI